MAEAVRAVPAAETAGGPVAEAGRGPVADVTGGPVGHVTGGPGADPGPGSLLRTGGPSLWSQLLADLYRRLDAGAFATGFPGELELVEQYGVSRHTVREALRRLRADGVVVAGRGRRPRLADPVRVVQPLGALYSLFAAVEAAGLVQTSAVRVLDLRADGVVAARLGREESTPLVHLERLRLADGRPLALDRVWLPADLAAPLLAADFTRTSLYQELAGRAGVRLDGGRESIRALVPGRAERRLLGLGADGAAFAIDRLGRSAGTPVEWRHTLVRGDRFELTAESSARTGYRLDVGGRTMRIPTPSRS